MHQSSVVDLIGPAPRDVYISRFTMASGHRWVWSVDSRGVQVNLKTIPPGADPTPIINALRAELDAVDPIVTPAFSCLRLVG